MGFRTDNLRSCCIPYLVFTLISSTLILSFLRISGLGQAAFDLWQKVYPLTFLVVISSVSQEFIFRGLLMNFLRNKFKSAVLVIFLDALVYSIIHLIFPYRELLTLGAFLLGLGFASIYYYYPNLILVSISHTIINCLILFYCYLFVSCS